MSVSARSWRRWLSPPCGPHPLPGPLSAVAATLLVVDAWFDVVTSGRGQLSLAVASAVLLELPPALLCAWVAVNAERVRARAYRRLGQRAEHATRVAMQLAARERLGSHHQREGPG